MVGLVGGMHVGQRGGQPAAVHQARFYFDTGEVKPGHRLVDVVGLRPGVEQRTHGHVARDPGERMKPGDRGHAAGPNSRNTAQAAPKPLSIPTTVIPEAQLESMASSAVTPSRAAPYPTLVGTATTGAAVRPPTTLASAPSMPATTTTAVAVANSWRWGTMRCRPATPTSLIRCTLTPKASKTTAHSSATGPSAVPAVTTSTGSVRAFCCLCHTTVAP